MKMRILPLFLIVLTFSIYPQAQSDISRRANEYAGSEALINGQCSFYAEYTDSGQPVIDISSSKALAPASCLKLLTSSAALAGLGKDYRYQTKLWYTGTIAGGVLKGHLYIEGSGDPSLGSSQAAGSPGLDSLMSVWVTAVRKAGISRIDGKVVADANKYGLYMIPEDWTWADMGNYYGAGTSSLTIHDNLYRLFFKPADSPALPAAVLRTEPAIKWLSFINYMSTGKPGSGDNGYIYCAPLQRTAVLRGTVPAGEKEFEIKGSIPDPPYFAAWYLKEKLTAAGIAINSTTETAEVANERPDYKNAVLLHNHTSPALEEIVYIINKKSNNLYTEMVLRELAYIKYGNSSTETGIEALFDFMKNSSIPVAGVYLHDGCGLSRSDAITTKTLARLLSFNTKQPYFETFYNSLGIAGNSGDISSFRNTGKGTIIENNARIKDGYIGGVRSHSGYVKARNGRLIAFSFISNNFNGSSRNIGNMYIDLIMKLAELN